jgi:hypothetical protein
VLLFFDVKPVTVKAYGGRRYTREYHPVLERRQRTRGLFYLFLAYEVNTGRRRWAFFAHKDSDAVCRFMQQVRRWYADQPVWVVLDRDSPHPCKSRQTRRQMRQLKLHWITLPTGSPDDNPVETLFSDIQLMILDTSNDPDIRTTQRRISNYLRRCNRRRQRTVCVPYLPDSSKHS